MGRGANPHFLTPIIRVFFCGLIVAAAANAVRAQGAPASSTAPQVAATAAPQAPNAAAASAAIPSYPDTAKGLEEFVKAMVKAEKKGDKQTVQAYANSLVLPDAEKWFRSVFGDDLGPQYEKASERTRSEIGISAPDTIAAMIAEKQVGIRVMRLESSCYEDETDRAYSLLLQRARTEPVYDVQFSGSRDSAESQWAYFAYVSGGFRHVGNPQTWEPELDGATDADLAARRPGVKWTAPNLLRYALAPYPEIARRGEIQGTVVFRAIIGRDGAVHSLELVQGPCILAEAARKAISQWRYAPALLQEGPVDTETTIKMDFTLGQ